MKARKTMCPATKKKTKKKTKKVARKKKRRLIVGRDFDAWAYKHLDGFDPDTWSYFVVVQAACPVWKPDLPGAWKCVKFTEVK
jgi:hypothetical protein